MADIPKQENALSQLFSPIQIGNLQCPRYRGSRNGRNEQQCAFGSGKRPRERELRDWRCGGTA